MNMHTLVGAGASEGSLDAANILKPALSRGEIQNNRCYYLKRIQKIYRKRCCIGTPFSNDNG